MDSASNSGIREAVTAVIISFNSGPTLLQCVQALGEQLFPLAAIIIVDNGSQDGSLEQVRQAFPETKIIALNQNRGLSMARNIGLKAVETEYVLLLDDDIYVRHNTIPCLMLAAQQYSRAIISPRFILYPERQLVQSQGANIHFVGLFQLCHGYQPVATASNDPRQVGGAIGGCYFGRTAFFTTPGGFDDRYFSYFEDLEFSLRMRMLGYEFVTIPAAEIDHDRGAGGLSYRGLGAYPRERARHTMRHRWLTILNHYQLRSLILLAPGLLLYEFLHLGFVAVNGWWRDWLANWRWLWRQRTENAIRRRLLQGRRVLGDRELLVTGALTLAPGLLSDRRQTWIVSILEFVFNLNWLIARRFLS